MYTVKNVSALKNNLVALYVTKLFGCDFLLVLQNWFVGSTKFSCEPNKILCFNPFVFLKNECFIERNGYERVFRNSGVERKTLMCAFIIIIFHYLQTKHNFTK